MIYRTSGSGSVGLLHFWLPATAHSIKRHWDCYARRRLEQASDIPSRGAGRCADRRQKGEGQAYMVSALFLFPTTAPSAFVSASEAGRRQDKEVSFLLACRFRRGYY